MLTFTRNGSLQEGRADHQGRRLCHQHDLRFQALQHHREMEPHAVRQAKARLEEVTEEISQEQTQRANYEAFLKAFKRLPDQLPEFTLKTWHGLVDYVTVYAEDDIRFTFKNGQEVKA